MCLCWSWLTPWTGHSRRSAGRPSWPVAWSSAPAAVGCPAPLSCTSPPDRCTSAVRPGAHPSTSTNKGRKQLSQSSWKKITFSTKKRINRQERTTVTNRERKQLIRFNPHSFWDILLTWGSPNLEKLTLDFNLPLQKEHVEEKRNQDQKLIYSVLWPCSLLSWKENRNLASSFFPGLSYHSKPNVNLLLMSMETLQKDLELVKHKKIQLELIFYNKSNIGTWFVASNSIMVLSRFLISIFKANSLASKSFSLEKTSIQILKLIWLYLYTYNNWVWKKLL